MSFMFNPYPYDDPNAYNVLDADGINMEATVTGNVTIAQAITSGDFNNCVIGIDGYTTVPYDILENLIEQQSSLRKLPITVMHTADLFRPAAELESFIRENHLPEDREKDPVLLYGKLFHGDYEDLFDSKKLEACRETIKQFKKNGEGILLVIGAGSLCASLRSLYDKRIFADITPMHTMLNLKKGFYKNIGCDTALTFKLMARRCYYIDFEVAAKLRGELICSGEVDQYIIANNYNRMVMMPLSLLNKVFDRAMCYPLRCKPVYLEGVWGGYYIQRLRNLPKEMKNCAWVFDFIPMEVSIVFRLDGQELEFPFYTLVQAESEKLMGKESVKRFGAFFPVRFNYDDTWHANGNMSVQCHPGEAYVKENNGELGRQDESYYIVEAAQGAKTYLGFNEGVDVEEFIAETKRSEKEATPIDYQKYVYAVESVPGTQVMIPAGTIHASGRNQLILEIGSLTVGSYTYKMYDYLRKDLDGKPRPIHTYHGDQVLNRSYTASWVKENLVQPPKTVCSGKGWEEYIVGEHDLLYFSLRNLKFEAAIPQNTMGTFHVLALVDGEQVMIRSKRAPEYCFVQNYLEIVVIPADFGEYEIVNMKTGTTAIIHKTMLKQ